MLTGVLTGHVLSQTLKRIYPQRRKRKKELQSQKELSLFLKHLKRREQENRLGILPSALIFPGEKNTESFSLIYFSRTTKLKSNHNSNEIAMEVAFKLVIETALDIYFHNNLA